jgi:hypothetical protein
MTSTASIIVTALLAALFAFASAIKLLGAKQSLAVRDHLGITPQLWRTIGALEAAGVIGVLIGLAWPPLGVAAAVGLALLSVGAIVNHLRAHDRLVDAVPAAIGLGLAVTSAVLQA